MTDFGVRSAVSSDIEEFVDELEGKLDTLHADIAKLYTKTTHVFVDAVVFDDDPTTYTATGLDVSAYRKFQLLIDLAVTLAPTDIVIRVEFSDDDVTYYRYVEGPFGDLRYEDVAGAKLESVPGKCIAPYMRIYVVATGTDATNKFTLTVKAILTG